MDTLKLRRIHHADADATSQLTQLVRQLSLQADIVSPRGQELTKKVFGSPLTPVQVVERVCNDVRQKGISAVLHYTEQFDRANITAETLRVEDEEMKAAHAAMEPEYLQTIRRIRQNIWSFQSGLVHTDAVLNMAGKQELRLRYRPLRRVGVCVPGGAAAYPSTLLMTIVPAQAAGVKEIAVVMPPTPNGAYNKVLLATCRELGVREVYRVGGAQAVAALAYGVEGIPQVDMIVGPGNIFVTLAKKHVFGEVSIDCLAGPSEVVVLADGSAYPEYVAADMLAQAEHDPATSILITWHESLLDEVQEALERQLATLKRGEQARNCLERFGAFVLAEDAEQAIEWTNLIAPEHLHICTNDAQTLADRIDHAGAIFVGHHTPVALGDYAAGPSHVLPTGGTARFASGLSSIDFLKRSSVISFTPHGLAKIAEDVCRLAEKEGLTAHAGSVEIRLPATAPRKANPPAVASKK